YTEEDYQALALLQHDGEATALFLDAPADPPAGWKVLRSIPLMQMVLGDNDVPYQPMETVALGTTDSPEMLALAELTQPGPFGMRTHEMGTYLGIRREGMLVAMAGERLDRKSTRLNSSHLVISYAVFCLKKKKNKNK